MRAKNRYRLIVRREGLAPVAWADATRTDHIEIVDIDAGEAVLYWDLLPRDAKTVARMVRSDLAALEDREFFERWASFAGDEDLR
jgi:hypothetical protein